MKKIEFFAVHDAKKKLWGKLDESLLNHAKNLVAGDGPGIADVYRLQGLAEVHCYLKTVHQLTPAEMEALLQFADPLEAAFLCWEESVHIYSFPICDVLKETGAKKRLPLAEPELPKKLSLQGRLNAALKEARQHPPKQNKTHGDSAR